MDMEELSQSQIVLLTLLVSFVTSMATGIVTVSLMSQAPVSVAETVNRVIQKTIREVASPAVVTTSPEVKTIVVHESDQIASAVEKASPSIVRLYSGDGATFLGLGIVLKSSGTIATDVSAIGDATDIAIVLSGGGKAHGVASTHDIAHGIQYLSIATSTSSSTPAWVPVTIATNARLGQSIILIAGKSSNRVARGLVSTLMPAVEGSVPLVETDILGDNVMYGSPIVDTNGALVGLSTSISRASGASGFIPASILK